MNDRYEERTGERRPTPTEYMGLKRAKKNLEDLDAETYRQLSKASKVSKIRSICNYMVIKDTLKISN
jgi:hypothetical protein